ncbi:substrate-binding periplasmic protein [Arsukibacterium sp.]|uniref:substrate-binding periplasmic protein n=1 Tax=Arsukibacterium sp. TaxID=1977258 RepID=UPI002FDA615E
MLHRVLTLLLLLGWVLPAVAQQRLNIYTEHFPPYNFLKENQIVGINTELVKQACAELNLDCHFQVLPWLRAYEYALKDPQGAIYSTSRHPMREGLFQWVGPLASAKTFLYRLKSRPEIAPENLEQVKNFSVAVARGDIYELYFLEQGFVHGKNLLDFSSKAESVPLLLQQKVDLIIGSDQVIPVWLAKYGSSADLVVPVLALSDLGANYLALNPAISADLVKQLQASINAQMHSEQLQQIIQRYSVSSD